MRIKIHSICKCLPDFVLATPLVFGGSKLLISLSLANSLQNDSPLREERMGCAMFVIYMCIASAATACTDIVLTLEYSYYIVSSHHFWCNELHWQVLQDCFDKFGSAAPPTNTYLWAMPLDWRRPSGTVCHLPVTSNSRSYLPLSSECM